MECLDIGAKPAPAWSVREVEAVCRRYGIAVGLVVRDYPFSFVWGYLRSKLIVSAGLLNALTKEELIAVLEHEAAHHARRNDLLKWALTICHCPTPAFPLPASLYLWLNEEIKMVCDEVAARRSASPCDLTGAPARIKRLTQAMCARASQPDGPGFFADCRESFERRVTRDRSPEDATLGPRAESLSRSYMRIAFAGIAPFTSVPYDGFFIAPLAIHQAVESVSRIFHRRFRHAVTGAAIFLIEISH
jgi:hypothetical protein